MVHSAHVDGPVREGTIVEIHGPEGMPPYVVEWTDTGRSSVCFPGPDATVEHLAGRE